MTNDGLTDIEKAWLVSLDALLVQATPNAHAVTAGRIVDLWGVGSEAFREELARRAGVWRKRQSQFTEVVSDRAGPCQRLVELMDRPRGDRHASKPKRRRSARPVVRPSRRSYMPVRQISDAEAAKFMELIEAEGISVVFDPGVCVIDDDVFLPPLIVLDRVGVFFERIAPVYERGEFERPWSPAEMEPAIALAFDLALLVMLREKKWTWVVCDRYFSRLPWGHPCKVTPEGRPGWRVVTDMLENAELIERRTGQTWRLTRAGKAAAEQVFDVWRRSSLPPES